MSSPTSDEISRLGWLQGQVVGIAERAPHMQEELERLKETMGRADEGVQHHEGRFSAYL